LSAIGHSPARDLVALQPRAGVVSSGRHRVGIDWDDLNGGRRTREARGAIPELPVRVLPPTVDLSRADTHRAGVTSQARRWHSQRRRPEGSRDPDRLVPVRPGAVAELAVKVRSPAKHAAAAGACARVRLARRNPLGIRKPRDSDRLRPDAGVCTVTQRPELPLPPAPDLAIRAASASVVRACVDLSNVGQGRRPARETIGGVSVPSPSNPVSL
jgi:hypothetical protein